VNYSINHGAKRQSSITRTDRENGACEIIYVNEFQILNRHNALWINLSRIGKWLSVLFGLGLLFSFFGWGWFSRTFKST
jgi:hypothetical protein